MAYICFLTGTGYNHFVDLVGSFCLKCVMQLFLAPSRLAGKGNQSKYRFLSLG